MVRNTVTKQEIELGLRDIEQMLSRRLSKHGWSAFSSPHEALGVIHEEDFELVEAIKSNIRDHISDEMMDVAVAALFAYICNRYTNPRCEQ